MSTAALAKPALDKPALDIRGLVKHYRSGLLGRRVSSAAVDLVDLRVAPDEVVALVGESGSGKTTLARCALALLVPDQGQIDVLGTNIHSLRGRALDRFRRRVQPLFQDPDAHLNPGLRVIEILRETTRLHRQGEPREKLIEDVLDQVGLSGRRLALPHQLSGGERRRVGLARVLLCQPALVIADEPTAGLDAARRADLMALLLGAPGKRRHASLVISHDLPLMVSCADRLVVMLAGRVVERMSRAELGAHHHHPYTQALLHAAGLSSVKSATAGHRRTLSSELDGCPLVGDCTLERPVCTHQRPPELAHSATHQLACHALPQQQATIPTAPTPSDKQP